MVRAGLVVLMLAASPLVGGCGSDPACDDVDSLQQRLDGMDPDESGYNDVVEDLNRAEADCNTR
jgi:hypothetical protein